MNGLMPNFYTFLLGTWPYTSAPKSAVDALISSYFCFFSFTQLLYEERSVIYKVLYFGGFTYHIF
jgi:hypothetical protein